MFSDVKSNDELELVARVLGKGKTTPRAYVTSQKLLQYFKEPCNEKFNYKQLASSSAAELKRIDGIGKETASFIEAILLFARKLQSYKSDDFPIINCPEDIANLLMSEMRYYRKEVFKVLLLDSKNRVIKIETISTGILDASIIHAREVFKTAIDHMAASIILMHNHPSGSISPSSNDIEITKNLMEAGKLLGIEILDHIIIGDGKYLSMKEKRIM